MTVFLKGNIIKNRKIVYIVIFALLLALAPGIRYISESSDQQIHTVFEIIATLLSLFVGVLALVRFYTKKNDLYLFIGSGFIGAGILDAYHAFVTSKLFFELYPALANSLAPWSWNASRFFLAVLILAGWFAWYYERQSSEKKYVNDKVVYITIAGFTGLSFILIAFAQMFRAFYLQNFFGNPEEFTVTFIYTLALFVYLKKGTWKVSNFEHWLIISLIVAIVGQFLIFFSPFRFEFHLLILPMFKLTGYICVLTGLISSIFQLLKHSEYQKLQLKAEIKERELAESIMIRYRSLNQLILNAANEGIIGLDEDGCHIFVNPAAAKMLGYTQNELLGLNGHDTWHHTKKNGENFSAENCSIRKSFYEQTIFESNDEVFWRSDGTPFFVEYSASPLKRDDKIVGSMLIFKDITAQLEIKDKLYQLSHVVEQSPTIVMITNLRAEIQYTNQAFTNITGYNAEEIVGKNPNFLSARKNKTDYKKLWETLKSGKSWSGEFLNKKKNGELFWESAVISPLKNTNGEITHYAALKYDMSAEKDAEIKLKTYTEALEKSNQELQDFAFIASHDLQEPIRKIMTFGDRLIEKHKSELSKEGLNYLERMLNAASRMRKLINDLLMYSRIMTKTNLYEKINLNNTINNVLIDLELSIEESKAKFDVLPLDCVSADPVQLHQLFQNIIGNALKYQPVSNNPKIKISSKIVTKRSADNGLRKKFCNIYIEDNGIGFDEKYLEKIFVPFQRLHARSEYNGTGIGLAICKKIVERHNGNITAKSTPGKGSTFIIKLPVNPN